MDEIKGTKIFDGKIRMPSSICNPLQRYGIRTVEDIYKFDKNTEFKWNDVRCIGIKRILILSDTLVENGYPKLENYILPKDELYINSKLKYKLEEISAMLSSGNIEEAKSVVDSLLS